jgi:hypothetical protein
MMGNEKGAAAQRLPIRGYEAPFRGIASRGLRSLINESSGVIRSAAHFEARQHTAPPMARPPV